MAKRAIVMYLEQARIYGEDLCTAHGLETSSCL